jgi:superfamily II DNA helicase RecQ
MEDASTFQVSSNDMESAQSSGDQYLDILQNVFKHENFRSNQREIVDYLTSGKDTLAIIPTGGGKSVCYWISGLATTEVTIVITPLVSLMNDQDSKLRKFGMCVCVMLILQCCQKKEMLYFMNSQKMRLSLNFFT